VYLKKNNILGAPVWTRYRNQGSQWLRGELRIKDMQTPYVVVFEGSVGPFEKGVIEKKRSI
jgi:hypothetical protein